MSLLDDQVRSALDRVLASLTGQIEADLTASRSDILRAASDAQARAVAEATERAAAEASERAASEVRREAEQHLATLQQEFERQREELERTLNETRVELTDARQEARDRRQQHEAIERQLEQIRREAEEWRLAADTSRDEATVARRETEATREEAMVARQETEAARDEATVARRETEAAREEATVARRETEAAREETEAARRNVDEARQQFEERRRSADDAAILLNEIQQRLEAVQFDVELARRDAMRSSRLTTDLRALDGARSLGEVLDGLARASCQEGGRTAVFLVSDRRLRGWRAVGFDAVETIVGAELDPEGAGLLGEAAKSGRQDYRQGDGTSLPAFAAGETSRQVVALPVEVAGSVIAVLYADAPQADRPEGLQWTDAVDVMARYAGRVLEAITVRQAAAMWTPQSSTRPRIQGDRSASASATS